MRDYLLERICELEKWLGSEGKRITNWPIAAIGFAALVVILLISNFIALATVVVGIFVAKNDSEKAEPGVIELKDKDQLEMIIADSNCVLVDFWAAWCGPCLMMKPAIESVAEKFAGELVVVMIDATEFSDLSKKYSVTGLPALLFFRNSELIVRHAGALSNQHLTKMVIDKFEFSADTA